MPPSPVNHPLTGIAERIRVVVEQQRGQALDDMAESLLLEPESFRRLIEEHDPPLDAVLVLDVVASLAYCQGVDPQWLLTGQYDQSIHRHILWLGEDRGAGALRRVREFVQEQYDRLRRDTPPLSVPRVNSPESD